MNEHKEFKAKDLDQAIDAACKHFTVGRDKLEIEILSGGSSGIFGLVGKKQATVRARLRQPAGAKRPVLDSPLAEQSGDAAEAGQDAPAEETKAEAEAKPDKPKRSRRSRGRRRGKPKSAPDAAQAQEAPKPDTPADGGQVQTRQESRPARREQPAPPAKVEPGQDARGGAKSEQTRPQEQPQAQSKEQPGEPQPQEAQPKESPKESQPKESQEELQALAKDVVARLIRPMLPELPPLEVETEPGRVKVHIDDEEHSGLIIGHQGQTIAALQYLANRIIARKAKGNVRIHLDAGDYREKQDDNLRQLALSLADKAKSQGKMQSTRPLSSYHRRLVHLALQNDESITTRSKGDGPMKRVLILPRRENRQRQQ